MRPSRSSGSRRRSSAGASRAKGGTITQPNRAAARVIDASIVNFWAKYDGEAEEVPHVLQTEQYKTENDADYDSTWMLLEPLEQLEPPEQLEPRAEQAASRLRSGL